MSGIDWSKAPAWADRVLIGSMSSSKYWACDDRRKAIESDYTYYETIHFDEQLLVSDWRPSSPAWSGEGLPPVGVDLQWFSPVYGWIGGKVVAHDEQTTIVRHNDGYEGCYLHNLRPCRTPEQIAAEEREAAINDLAAELGGHWSEEAVAPQRNLAAYLHDIGYRKVEQPK